MAKYSDIGELLLMKQTLEQSNSGATDKALNGLGKEFDASGDMSYIRVAKQLKADFGPAVGEAYLRARGLIGVSLDDVEED